MTPAAPPTAEASVTAAEATAQEALKQAQVFANLRAVDDIVMSFAIKYSQNPLPVIAPVDDELEKMATAISSKKVVHHKWDSQLFHKKRKELAAKIKKVLKLKKVPYIYIYACVPCVCYTLGLCAPMHIDLPTSCTV